MVGIPLAHLLTELHDPMLVATPGCAKDGLIWRNGWTLPPGSRPRTVILRPGSIESKGPGRLGEHAPAQLRPSDRRLVQ